MVCSSPTRALALTAAFAIATGGVGGRAWAAEVSAEAGAPWAASETRDRGVALRAAIDDEARRARRWRWAWTGINAGLTAFSFGSMPFVSRAQWPELVIGGVGSALSTALTVAWPLDVEVASASAGDAASREDPLALRRQAIAAGRDESDRQRWPWHLVNVGVGAAYFAILGFGYGHWKNGVWAGMSALAIGEAQTLTQPMGATRFFPGVTW